MSSQSALSEWLSGFFDGEGYLTVHMIDNTDKNGSVSCSPKAGIKHTYIGGLLDAEGCLSLKISPQNKDADRYALSPRTTIGHNSGSYGLDDLLIDYCDDLGVDYSIGKIERDNPRHSDAFQWEVAGCDNLDRFLRSIHHVSVIKSDQIEIMLNQIIPRLKQEVHLSRRGLLSVVAWKDVMDSYKGGTRGKYNLSYFEKKWGMSIQDKQLPENHPRRLEE